jgi:putative transposase
MTFRPELINELLKDYKNPEDLMGEGGIFKQLTKALIERCLNAEMDTHLEEQQIEEPEAKNRRNGNILLVDCINSDCYISQEVRAEIEDTLLLSISSIQARQTKK